MVVAEGFEIVAEEEIEMVAVEVMVMLLVLLEYEVIEMVEILAVDVM